MTRTRSLVNKQWLHFARHHLFNDLRPIGHRLCHQCISHFTDLVVSRNCTIPRFIRTLRLNGKSTKNRWSNRWSLVGNPGSMQRLHVIQALMKHFYSVERLEMVCVHWFNPSWRSSRTVARFLSTVESLTLDDVSLYGGPRGLLWMLDKMLSLDVLMIDEPDWPSKSGWPNNPPSLLIFSLNAVPVFPLFFIPLYKALSGGLKVIERFRSRTIRKPLGRLAIDIRYQTMDDPWISWLLSQAQQLSSVTTLIVSTACSQEEVVICQALLDTINSLLHLTIKGRLSYPDDTSTSSPTLVEHKMLQSLSIHICLYEDPQIWIAWLKNFIHTVRSSCLTVIRLAKEMNKDNFTVAFGPQDMYGVGNIDRAISTMPDLRQLQISVARYFRQREGRGLSLEQQVRTAFRHCEAKAILSVRVIWGSTAEFLEEAG